MEPEVIFIEFTGPRRQFALGDPPLSVLPQLDLTRFRGRPHTAKDLGLNDGQPPMCVSEDPQRYRPHVSVAYISADAPALPYINATADVHTDAVRLRLRHVDLIELNRDHRMYEWSTIARLPLG